MSKDKTFPAHKTHNAAYCFNCSGGFGDAHWSESGHAPGHGQFVQSCCKCGMTTWYDLEEVK